MVHGWERVFIIFSLGRKDDALGFYPPKLHLSDVPAKLVEPEAMAVDQAPVLEIPKSPVSIQPEVVPFLPLGSV